jgi:hypothetical protein
MYKAYCEREGEALCSFRVRYRFDAIYASSIRECIISQLNNFNSEAVDQNSTFKLE